MMVADDIVGVPCGGREVSMTEYLDRGMRVSRLKTKFMDFALRQNESGNREPMKIIGE